jgi:uncharacterized membrane protein YczE
VTATHNSAAADPTSPDPTTTESTARAPRTLAALNPIEQLRAGQLPRRLVQLYVGLVLYGASMGLMIESNLGLDPWDVLHSGIINHVPLSFGTVVILMSFVVLLAWIPLRQWPGLGTISNAIIIGLATDLTLSVLTTPDDLWARIVFIAAGIVVNALAGALYIGAQFGPGPRDGLMTGLVRRTGLSVRLVRTTIEITVLAIGWLLGGVVGFGTVAYALAIGPLVHVLLPIFTVQLPNRK